MSEKPITFLDDKKSSQVTFNANKITKDHERNRAFFEHAESGNLYTPEPPEFDIYEEPKAFDPEMMNETIEQSFVTEAPVNTVKIVSHKENLERAYHYMDTPELINDTRLCTKAVIMIRKYGIAAKGA